MLKFSKKIAGDRHETTYDYGSQCVRSNILYIIIIAYVLGCSPDLHNNSKNVFKYNQADNITSLDPAFAKSQNNIWVTNQIYDGLVYLDPEKGVQARIAKQWKFDEDGKRIEFIIDQSYTFHKNECFDQIESRAVTAQDVKFSFERIISDVVNSPGSWIFSGIVDDKVPFEVLNDTMFVMNLQKPFNPILGILTMQYCSIIPHEAVEFYGSDFRKNPVGTGPFQFKRWKENHALYLAKNLNYPSIDHNLDGIKVSFIPDKKIAFFEFLNGNLDYFSGIESSFSPEVLNYDGTLKADKKDKIQMLSNPYLNLEYIGINMNLAESTILNQLAFRKAINYAIDRAEMLAVFKNNIGKPAEQGIIPRGLIGFDPEVKGFNYNPEKAKAILDSISYNYDANPISIATNADYLDIITYVAKSLENIGVNVKIELMESAVLRQQMRNENIDCFRASWIADYPDEESFLCLFYGKNPAPPNYTRFSNPLYDQLYEKAIVETNQSKRMELYQRMNKMVIEAAPIIPLYYDETALFLSKSIKSGLRPTSLNLLDTRKIQKR